MRQIIYKHLPGVTYEQELEVLAQIYARALESYRRRRQEAADGSGGDDARKEDQNVSGESIVP